MNGETTTDTSLLPQIRNLLMTHNNSSLAKQEIILTKPQQKTIS